MVSSSVRKTSSVVESSLLDDASLKVSFGTEKMAPNLKQKLFGGLFKIDFSTFEATCFHFSYPSQLPKKSVRRTQPAPVARGCKSITWVANLRMYTLQFRLELVAIDKIVAASSPGGQWLPYRSKTMDEN